MPKFTLLEDPTTIKIRLANSSKSITFNRSTGLGTLSNHSFQQIPTKNAKLRCIDGIYGMISLCHATYIVVVTKCKTVAWIPKSLTGDPEDINFRKNTDYNSSIKINNDKTEDLEDKSELNIPVYEIEKVDFVKLKILNMAASDSYFLGALSRFFEMPGLYFSDYPIYKSFIDQRYDEIDFLFNCGLGDEFKESVRGDCDLFLLKCFQGYVSSKKINYEMNMSFKNKNICLENEKNKEKNLSLAEKENILLNEKNISINKKEAMHDKDLNLNSEIVKKEMTVILISRRSWRRVGMRFFSRGVNDDGYASNFVESEQILCDSNGIVSFLQARGSIPLKWGHKVGIHLHPKIVLDPEESKNKNISMKEKEIKEETAFIASDDVLKLHYGQIFYLNLIQHIKYEKKLFEIYKKNLNKQKVDHLHFDFHNKKVHISDIAKNELKSQLKEIVKAHGFSMMNFNSNDLYFSEQKGIIRTNCIDSLDRTNVVQSMIGIEALEYQLKILLSNFSDKDKLIIDDTENYKKNYEISDLDGLKQNIENVIRKMYFENGNHLSIQYSGTPSLKSSVTTKGYQDFYGLVKDFSYTIKRYIYNRFYHGVITDGYGLATSNFTLSKKKNARRFRVSFKFCIFTYIVLVAFLHFIFGDQKKIRMSYILLSVLVGFLGVSTSFIDYFIDYPKYWKSE